MTELWRDLGSNTSQIQALAAVLAALLGFLIWLVYRRQARIMAKQAQVLSLQTELQKLAGKREGLLAMASIGPVIVPDQLAAGSLGPTVHGSFHFTLKNTGHGCAFALRATGWKYERGQWVRRGTWAPATQFLGSKEATILTCEGVATEAERVVLVLHYQDFTGERWHTTWNLSPVTGGYQKSDCPVVWNPRKWKDTPGVHCFCPHCSSAKP